MRSALIRTRNSRLWGFWLQFSDQQLADFNSNLGWHLCECRLARKSGLTNNKVQEESYQHSNNSSISLLGEDIEISDTSNKNYLGIETLDPSEHARRLNWDRGLTNPQREQFVFLLRTSPVSLAYLIQTLFMINTFNTCIWIDNVAFNCG